MPLNPAAPVTVAGNVASDIWEGQQLSALDDLVKRNGLGSAQDVQTPGLKDVLVDPNGYAINPIADPNSAESRNAQLAALMKLSSIGAQGGMDPESRAAIAEAQNAADQQVRGQQQAVQARLARQGMNQSGMGAAMQAQAAQGAANQFRQGALDASAAARQRALAAIQSSGQLASQMRGGDQTAAQAEMARQEFNSRMRAAADTQNAANRFNLTNSQIAKSKNLQGAVGQYANQHRQTVDKQANAFKNDTNQAAGMFDDGLNP